MASIEDEIIGLRDRLQASMRRDYARDLPLQDLLTDRWERARELGFGSGASIYASAYVYGDVTVGPNCWIGPMVLLDGTGGLQIGPYCDISAGAQIYTHDTVERVLSNGNADVARAPVSIGSNCHIGALAVVLKGVSIGHHSVVGAGAVVTRDVPAYSVMAGVPARSIGRVVVNSDGSVSLAHDTVR